MTLVLVLCLAVAACGQKPDVHVGLAGSGGAAGGLGGDAAATGSGFVAEDGTVGGGELPLDGAGAGVEAADGTTPAGAVGGPAAGPAATGPGTVATGGSSAPGPSSRGSGAAKSPGSTGRGSGGGAAGDSTGVTDDEIVIGFHAPITGAAPLPQSSFKKGLTQYWNYRGKVDGRTVRIIVRDDTYNPSRATQVCNQMIQQDKVFILGGAGGADQIAACARVAAQAGVPYISAGVDEGILRKLPNYFAFSMSYPQQAPLLVQWVMKHAKPANGVLGIIRDRTPSFNLVVQRVTQEAEKAGLKVLVRQAQNGPSDAQWLATNGIQTAFPIMSPSAFVQIVNSPGGGIRNWVGVGLTMGLNTVASATCPNIDGAMFFSPFPGLNTADKLDPNFRKQGGEDDIQWALWGSNKWLDVVLGQMNGEYTREAFVRTLETKRIKTGIYADSRHSPENHFGINTVHVLRADCGRRQWVTTDDGMFRKGF